MTLILLLEVLQISADELLCDYLQPPNPKTLQIELARIADMATPKQTKRITAYARFEIEYSKEERT